MRYPNCWEFAAQKNLTVNDFQGMDRCDASVIGAPQ
jgi:hypothetical protein